MSESDQCRPNVRATFITTTTYGTWLPGDMRGYIDRGVILPANPKLLRHAKAMMSESPVYFTDVQVILLDTAIRKAAEEFQYRLTDMSIESWHLHWIIEHGFDPVHRMAGRLKTRMRQMLRRGRIWTNGYHHRCLYDDDEIETARGYIAKHAGCRMIDGQRAGRAARMHDDGIGGR